MTCEVEVSDVSPVVGTDRVKRGMAEMLKGGVIMDVGQVVEDHEQTAAGIAAAQPAEGGGDGSRVAPAFPC